MCHLLSKVLEKLLARDRLIALISLVVGGILSNGANAAVLTADLEVHLIPNVSTAWQTVALSNSYSNAIPICTYNLISFSGVNPNYDFPPAAVRIRNITASSFDVRIQGWEDSAAVAADVHCLVTDEGAFTLPNGTKYEAHTVLSDQTSGQFSLDGGWDLSLVEDVSGSITQTYTNHVVLGQVISHNDNRASVFYTNDCDSRVLEPFNAGQADGICVGKQIIMIPGTRNPETIGYLVAESGSGIVNGVTFELDRGSDFIAGNSATNVGYSYDLTGDYSIGIASMVGVDGANGGYAVLYGSDPLPADRVVLAIDEEIFSGNGGTTRNHTREIVDYWVFGTAELTLMKSVVNDNGGTAVASDFRLGASGPEVITGYTGEPEITDYSVPAGTYNLAESGPSGYTGTWSCTEGTLAGTVLTLAIDDQSVCTLVNDDIFIPLVTYLTLEKQVINDGGGTAIVTDFELSFDNGSGNTGSGVQGDSTVTGVVVPPGSYNVFESPVAGYVLLRISCNGTDADGSDGLELIAGENVTCTFVNDDKGVDLEIGKSVSNDSPNIGDVVTFTIVVTNNGPDTATEVQVTDPVLAGFSYVSASMTGGDTMQESSTGGTTSLDWSIATLATGASVTLTYQATVLAP